MTSDLSGVDDESDMHIPGGGKLAECGNGHVLGSVAVQGSMM